jgi:hypothetical protein
MQSVAIPTAVIIYITFCLIYGVHKARLLNVLFQVIFLVSPNRNIYTEKEIIQSVLNALAEIIYKKILIFFMTEYITLGCSKTQLWNCRK